MIKDLKNLGTPEVSHERNYFIALCTGMLYGALIVMLFEGAVG